MNDESEQFERRLSCQPVRKIPGEWRSEILSACRESKVEGRESEQSKPSTLVARLSTIFWPHPKAWAGLAAVWIFILALNFSLRDTSPRMAEKSAPPSPEVIVELKKERLLFAEWMGPLETPDADRQKMFSPKPRSERAEILTT